MKRMAAHKYRELRHKLDGLALDFARWRAESEDQKPLRLHQSQIAALLGPDKPSNPTNKAPLSVLWRTLDARLRSPKFAGGQSDAVLDEVAELEYLLSGAHAVWGFFREKLAQRYTPDARDFLSLADELAWACYQPALKAAQAKKSPPLVYLVAIETLGTGEVLQGAALIPRGADWLPAETPGALRDPVKLKGLLTPLAIPIMAIPWGQASHLPELPIVAHEVGHAVEDDFGLTHQLQKVMTGALQKAKSAGKDPGAADAWSDWMGELFADFHGVAHLGPAYVSTLTDLLAGTQYRTLAEDRSLGIYPTNSLRLRINRAALKELGFEKAAIELEARWRTAVPDDPQSPLFDAGIPFVAEQFLRTPLAGLHGATLEKLGDWSDQRRNELRPSDLKAKSLDTRLITAVMRGVYDQDPDQFFPKGDTQWRDRLKRCLPPQGTRGGKAPATSEIDLATLLLDLRQPESPKGEAGELAISPSA